MTKKANKLVQSFLDWRRKRKLDETRTPKEIYEKAYTDLGLPIGKGYATLANLVDSGEMINDEYDLLLELFDRNAEPKTIFEFCLRDIILKGENSEN